MAHSALLVNLEGIDGAGKGTQAALLCQRLRSAGKKAAVIGFPRYAQTLFGRAVGEYLDGQYGALSQVHPFLVALLFAGDRLESLPLLQQAMKENDVVILDRYVASNVAHQAAKRLGAQRQALAERILEIEFRIHALPRPDLVILLDLPVGVARQLVGRKAARVYTQRAADIQEADAAYLEEVRGLYLELARGQKPWHVIDVCPGGHLREAEQISEEVCGLVWARLS